MMDGAAIEARISVVVDRLTAAKAAVGDVIIGQSAAVEQSLAAILSGGHALLTGVPGLGKTKLVETLAIVLGLATRRVQFTPDLMPSDILGSEVLDETPAGRRFRFIPGPIFTELLMADEINRASPRTQSALLQAMAEGHVAVAGENRPVPTPFHVLATQNPIEQEGTYPLPEAQLDRFLLDIRIDYPNAADERTMLVMTTGMAQAVAEPVLSAAELIEAQNLVRAMPVVITSIVRSSAALG
jgi:MoxR-like ATPase